MSPARKRSTARSSTAAGVSSSGSPMLSTMTSSPRCCASRAVLWMSHASTLSPATRSTSGENFIRFLIYCVMAFTAEHSLRCRKDFPALMRDHAGANLAFLDGPGGSQVPQVVIDTMVDFYASCNVNTHGKFAPSQEVDRRMDLARTTLAAFLGAEAPSCISFGQNMTTLNYALSGAIGRTLSKGDEVLVTQLDHEANRGPWLRLQDHGVIIQEVRLMNTGRLDLDDMRAKI